MSENDVKIIKSEDFALRIVFCYKHLTQRNEEKEFILSKQLLRSGTSIGANIAEAVYAESREDFIHKLKIAQKEAGETIYWLKLLSRAQILEKSLAHSLKCDCMELLKIISAVIISVGKSNKQ